MMALHDIKMKGNNYAKGEVELLYIKEKMNGNDKE